MPRHSFAACTSFYDPVRPRLSSRLRRSSNLAVRWKKKPARSFAKSSATARRHATLPRPVASVWPLWAVPISLFRSVSRCASRSGSTGRLMILLDTNSVSELLRAAPEPEAESAMSEAELRLGITILPAGRRRDALASMMDEISAGGFPGAYPAVRQRRHRLCRHRRRAAHGRSASSTPRSRRSRMPITPPWPHGTSETSKGTGSR